MTHFLHHSLLVNGDDPFELGQGFVIDVEGRARATHGLADQPFGDLVRAFETQLIPADPHEIRVLLRVPRAGVGGAGWESFETGFKWFLASWMAIGGVYGSFEALQKIVQKFRRASEVLLRHKDDLEQRGFAPPDAIRLAAAKRWKVSELSELLYTSPEEATNLLEGFGFLRDEAGTWRSPPDRRSRNPPSSRSLSTASQVSHRRWPTLQHARWHRSKPIPPTSSIVSARRISATPSAISKTTH
jgi:hypothetical protein